LAVRKKTPPAMMLLLEGKRGSPFSTPPMWQPRCAFGVGSAAAAQRCDHVGAMSYLTLEQFRRGYLPFQSAFNRRDFATAFDVLTPDCEFSTIEELLEARVMVGREEVRRYFEHVLIEPMPDWRFENEGCLKASDDVFATGAVAS
jgi:hypothetical protein